jgi:hypothetical protein
MYSRVVRRLANKALHQTRREGVLASRAVVEALLAGEGRCWAFVGPRSLASPWSCTGAQQRTRKNPRAMPPPADSSWQASLARGARAPDMAGLQGAVIRYAAEEWPRRERGAPRLSTLCLTVLPPPGFQGQDPDDQPLDVHRLLYDTSPATLGASANKPDSSGAGVHLRRTSGF